jgi:Family of unknown function (DUF6011)
MNTITRMLMIRQADSKVSTCRTLCVGTGHSATEIQQMLLEDVQQGTGKLAYWPEFSTSAKLYYTPTEEAAAEVELSRDEILWPQLSSALMTENFAARIYVHNASQGELMSKQLEQEDLYRELALQAFGPAVGWDTVKHGLNTTLPDPLPQKAPKKTRAVRTERSEAGEGRCQMCGKALRVDVSVKRGIGPECWKSISASSGIAVAILEDPEQTTDEQLTKLIEAVRSNRPSYTQEEADKAYPEGIISIKQLVDIANTQGISTSQIIRNLGGDRGLYPPRNPKWKAFLIGRERHLSRHVLEDLPSLPRSRRSNA